MKNLLPAIAFVCLTVSAIAEDFGNWYFQYLLPPCNITGNIFKPDMEKSGTFTGTSTGEISPGGKKFTESFEYVYEPGGSKAKASLTWTKGADGIFRTSGADPGGNPFSSELKVAEDNKYKLVCKFADGRTIVTEAEMKPDKVIYATDTGRTKDGVVVFIMKYVRSKAKAEVGKAEG